MLRVVLGAYATRQIVTALLSQVEAAAEKEGGGEAECEVALPFWGAGEREPGTVEGDRAGASRLRPSHTTVRTGPYTAVRLVERCYERRAFSRLLRRS